MKFWQRFFSLFSCLVLLFAVFSIPVAAADDVPTRKVNIFLNALVAGEVFGQQDVLEGETGSIEGEVYHSLAGKVNLGNRLTVANNDASILFPAGSDYVLTVENVTFSAVVTEDNGKVHSVSYGHDTAKYISVSFVHADGTSTPATGDLEIILNEPKDNHSLKLSFTADTDILKVVFHENINVADHCNFTSSYGYVHTVGGFEYPLKVTIKEIDKSVGLLEGLLAWVKNIGEKVSDSFDVINSGFANIGTWFAELPSKIWSVMENGIKGLFVPDQQYMESYSNKWEQLLSDRLGAVYQVCDITLNSWDAIMHADETNTITFPLVTIPLPDSASFSFGGYEVKIVPDGFSALATAVKSAVGILCTYLFVNGLMKRYEEVMGVKE